MSLEYIKKLLIQVEDNHPLNKWKNMQSIIKTVESALEKLNNNKVNRRETLVKNIKSDINNFWAYLAELFICANILNSNQQIDIEIEPSINNKENKSDLLVGGDLFFEITSFNKNVWSRYFEEEFWQVCRQHQMCLRMEYCPQKVTTKPSADQLIENIKAKILNGENYCNMPNSKIYIEKSSFPSISIKSQTDGPIRNNEFKIYQTIIDRIKEKEKQLSSEGENILVIEMSKLGEGDTLFLDDRWGITEKEFLSYKDKINYPHKLSMVILWWITLDSLKPWNTRILFSKNDNVKSRVCSLLNI